MFHYGKETDTIPISSSVALNPAKVEKTSFSKIVKRAGIVYDLLDQHGFVDSVKTYFNYSEGFQPQTLLDKNANAVSYPQAMKQYEAGLKGEFLNHALGSALAIYHYKITNVPASATPIGQYGSFGNVVADGSQTANGVEAELTGEILPGWNLTMNYAYTDAYIENPKYTFAVNPANVPKHKGAAFSSFEFLQGPLKGLRLGGGVVVSSKYPLVQGLVNVAQWGQIDSNGYTRVDLNASYKGFIESLSGLEVYTNIHNVLNDRVLYSKEGRPSYAIEFSDLRSFNIGVRYKF